MDAAKSVLNTEPSSRFLFLDASECVGDRVGERRGELLARDCDCDRVGEPWAEAGVAGLRKTYEKCSNGVASDGFMDDVDNSGNGHNVLIAVVVVVVCYC